jgi:hypothetical protein
MTHEPISAGSLSEPRPAPTAPGEASAASEVAHDLHALRAVVEGTAEGTVNSGLNNELAGLLTQFDNLFINDQTPDVFP